MLASPTYCRSAAGIGALAGIGYTLLTGAEVPTVRSCVGAVLVLGALALGREPLSLRMLAVGAVFVLLLWPESLAGPSFELSFAAVIAIVALHGSAPVRAFPAPREEAWITRIGRRMAMLLVTGVIIEVSLMPIALALALDLVGLGAPVWWLAGKSLAVRLMPQMGWGTFVLFIGGGLWLALWRGKARLWGLAPTALASVLLLTTPAPDVLIAGDAHNVGIAAPDGRLLLLRDSRSDFTRDNFKELAGIEAEPVALEQWPGAECNADFCAITVHRAGRDWRLLLSRSRYVVDAAALAQACARADIVVADRWLPRTCLPMQLKADGKMLAETGGLSIVLADPLRVTTVASSEGEHGWWRASVVTSHSARGAGSRDYARHPATTPGRSRSSVNPQ